MLMIAGWSVGGGAASNGTHPSKSLDKDVVVAMTATGLLQCFFPFCFVKLDVGRVIKKKIS